MEPMGQGLLYVRGQSVLDITFSKSFFNLRMIQSSQCQWKKYSGCFLDEGGGAAGRP